jgi:hypothetical protein
MYDVDFNFMWSFKTTEERDKVIDAINELEGVSAFKRSDGIRITISDIDLLNIEDLEAILKPCVKE